MAAQKVLFIGDTSHHEFREPVAWLREYCDLTIATDIDGANTCLTADDPPAVVIVAAARPGLFSQQQISSWLRRAPLARFIGLMGGWCEGELRTGQPWRGVTRVYWHEFVPRMSEELMGVNKRGRLAMPRTFTEAELSGIRAPLPEPKHCGLVAIRATSLETYDTIAEACCAIGHSTVWANSRQPTFASGAIAAIWDSTGAIEKDRSELVCFAERMASVPLIAIIGFPRASDRDLAIESGASAVISKPYLLQELWTELTRVTSECRRADERISVA